MDRSADLAEAVPALLETVSAVEDVELCGSRRRGDAGRLSDWDFVVRTNDFTGVTDQLATVLDTLDPLVGQWDRLSRTRCFMLIVPGPHKIDLIFEGVPNEPQPPWVIDRSSLGGVDAHFWDWTLWLASKVEARTTETVDRELHKMHEHLLGPLGIDRSESLTGAVNDYVNALPHWERRLRITVDPTLQTAVLPIVRGLQNAAGGW